MAQKHLDDIQRGNLIQYLLESDRKFVQNLVTEYLKSPAPPLAQYNEQVYKERMPYVGNFLNQIDEYFFKIKPTQNLTGGSFASILYNAELTKWSQRKIGSIQLFYLSLQHSDKEAYNYKLLSIETSSSGFDLFREKVLVPLASTAADVGAVATVAAGAYGAYSAIMALAAPSTTVAAASAESAAIASSVEGGAIAGQTGLLTGSVSTGGIVASSTTEAGLLSGIGLSSSQIAGAGALITTAAQDEVKKFVDQLSNPKEDKPLIEPKYSVSSGMKGSIGATLGLGVLALIYFLI